MEKENIIRANYFTAGQPSAGMQQLKEEQQIISPLRLKGIDPLNFDYRTTILTKLNKN